MAAPFDFARLDPTLYDLSNMADCIKFQVMVEEFMEIVRGTPEALAGHHQQLHDFCSLLLLDGAFPLASAVVEEFDLSQDYDTSEDTALNWILRKVHYKRPKAGINDPSIVFEKRVLRMRYRHLVDYLETCIHGTMNADETAAAEDRYNRVIAALED